MSAALVRPDFMLSDTGVGKARRPGAYSGFNAYNCVRVDTYNTPLAAVGVL